MTFEEWAKPILGDNPNWRESGDGELARQAYQAGREAMKAECVKVCEEQYEYYGYDHIFAKKIKELK